MTDRKVKVILDAQVSGFQAKMAAAGKSVGDTANKMTGAEKESAKFRRGLTSVGDTAGKAGLIAAAGVGAIVYATANFDQAMSNVQAATHETAANMDLLREAAIKAGADTAFSASEAAAGIENLAKAGVSTSDILGGGLAGALDLAAAGEMEVADAAEVAATAMTQFNLEGTKVPHIADLLAAAAGKAQGDVSDMAMALKQSGLVASQMGLSIEETTGTLAAFASAGLIGSDAGTSFRTMLLRLANPSQESADLMKALGINAYDATGAFVGMEAIAGQLQAAFEGKTQAERDSAFATIFGSDAIRGASVLYQQGAEGVSDWTGKVDDAGYAAETAGIKLNNLLGDLEELGGSLETALIGAGDGSQGVLRELVQNATDAVNVFNDLPSAVQGSVTSLMGLTAVTGGGLWFGSKVIGGVANTRAALVDLGLSADKAKGGLAGVGKSLVIGGAVLAGVNALDKALEDLFNTTLDGSSLDRSLEALSRGEVMGSLEETWGKDLQGFKGDLTDVTWAIENLGDVGTTAGRVLNNIPFDGGFFSGGVDDARDNIEQLDRSLASLVEGGQTDMAAAIFEQFAAKANDAGISTSKLRGILSEYGVALSNVESSTSGFDALLAQVGGEARGTAKEIKGVSNALSGLDAALTGRASLRDYQAALDAVTESVKENGKNLNINTRKGRENQAALDGIAASALEMLGTLKGAEKQAFLKQARADFRAAARELGLSKAATRALMEELGLLNVAKAEPKTEVKGVPKAKGELVELENLLGVVDGTHAFPEVKPKGVPGAKKDLTGLEALLGVVDGTPANPHVEPQGIPAATQDLTGLQGLLGLVDETDPSPFVELLGAGEANAEIDGVQRNLSLLDGDTATTHIVTSYSVRGTPGAGQRIAADGATVPDDGGGYFDRFPYLLAPREEVVTNRRGEADTFRPELKDINSGMSRAQVWERMMLRGLADGGTVPGLARGGTAKGRSLDQRLDIAQLATQIADLRLSLRGRGDDRLGKLQRRVAELQLKIAERDLRAAQRQHLAERAERRVERERAQLDRARQSLAAVRSEASNFRNTVVGAVSSGNPFGNGLEGALLTLEHDREKAQQMLAGTRKAQELGLDGAALKALLESGDVMAAQDIDTKAEVQQLERLFAQTQAAQQQLGGFARSEVYGRELQGLRSDVQQLAQGLREQQKRLRPINVNQNFPASANPRSVASAAAQRLRARGI